MNNDKSKNDKPAPTPEEVRHAASILARHTQAIGAARGFATPEVLEKAIAKRKRHAAIRREVRERMEEEMKARMKDALRVAFEESDEKACE